MKLYDSLFRQFRSLVETNNAKLFQYDSSKIWQETKDFEIVFQMDTSVELGGSGKASANFTCITTNQDYLNDDGIFVYGKDIANIEKNTNFVRVSEILVRDDLIDFEDTDSLYNLIQDIDFVKYHFFPKGYMVRISGQSTKEQVRISKEAIDQGISFEHIGNSMISHYKQNPNVLAVRISFITQDDMNYKELQSIADQASEVKNSLAKIHKGMSTECSTCGIKDICSEVEGLRELHFGKQEKTNKDKKKMVTQIF